MPRTSRTGRARPSGSVRTPLLPATVGPDGAECDAALVGRAMTPSPLLRRPGTFDVEASDAYAIAGSALLAAGPKASSAAVLEAAWRDLRRFGAVGAAFVVGTERLAATYYG